LDLRPAGGIFLRRGADGNLTVFDTAGSILAKFIGSEFAGTLAKGTPSNNAPIGTTTSTSDVSTGYGNAFTPRVSGNAVIVASFIVGNTVANIGSRYQMYLKTNSSTIPAGGTAVGADTALGGIGLVQDAEASQVKAQTMSLITTGLTIDTPYVFYIAFRTDATGTAQISNVQPNNPIVIEI